MNVRAWLQRILGRQVPSSKFAPDWRPSAVPLRSVDDEFDGLVVVHFWASWNRVDRDMDKTLCLLEHSQENSCVAFRSCCTDDEANWPLCQDCQVGNLPALAAFVKGKRIATLIGLRPFQELQGKIDEWRKQATGK